MQKRQVYNLRNWTVVLRCELKRSHKQGLTDPVSEDGIMGQSGILGRPIPAALSGFSQTLKNRAGGTSLRGREGMSRRGVGGRCVISCINTGQLLSPSHTIRHGEGEYCNPIYFVNTCYRNLNLFRTTQFKNISHEIKN